MVGEIQGLVSVIMPAYNSEWTLRDAVICILNPSNKKFELIIVDDGSTDTSQQILVDLARSDDRLRVVRTFNRGVTAFLNSALKISRGDLIARMDPDDICAVRRLTVYRAITGGHPALIGCAGKHACLGCVLRLVGRYAAKCRRSRSR